MEVQHNDEMQGSIAEHITAYVALRTHGSSFRASRQPDLPPIPSCQLSEIRLAQVRVLENSDESRE